MEPSGPGDRPFALYLAGVVVLSASTILLLVAVFVTRVPSFTTALARNPPAAVRDDPVAVVLLLSAGLSTLALFALVVGFGARYGLAEPPEGERPGERD